MKTSVQTYQEFTPKHQRTNKGSIKKLPTKTGFKLATSSQTQNTKINPCHHTLHFGNFHRIFPYFFLFATKEPLSVSLNH